MTFAIRLLLAFACLAPWATVSMSAPAALDSIEPDSALPASLHDTGLYQPGTPRQLRAGVVPFSPQYPLWSDGAEKRRWISLPPGTFIDGARPDAWEFPRGTRLWKEFSHGGRPVETRYIERRLDGSWRFAAYIWNEAGDKALLAPRRGNPSLPVALAPGGRYAVPGRADCLACHASTAVPVLGVNALQLSPDRDPMASGGQRPSIGEVDLRGLVARGWLRGLPAKLVESPPRIAAATAVERAALGYLHANCSHCHNTTGLQAPVRLTLAQRAADPAASREEVLRSAIDAASRYQPPREQDTAVVIAPGRPDASVLAARMRSREPLVQMPPLGTALPDAEGIALVHRWITHDLTHRKEVSP